MKKRKLLLSLLLISLLLLGCADPKILERISLAILIGYDTAEEDKITATVALRSVNQDYQSIVNIASETELTSKGTRIKVNLDSSKKIAAGQLRVVLLGDKLAEGGINEILYSLVMNSEISNSVYIAVAKGESKSLIDKKYQNVSDIGQHIFNLMEHNVEEELIISSTLHETVRDNYSPMRDMALPIIEQNSDDVRINGLAIFNDDKMVGKLTAKDTFFVVLIRDRYKAGTAQLTISGDPFKNSSNGVPDQLAVAIDSIQSKRKIRLINQESPEFDLDVKIECRVLEIHSSIFTEDSQIIEKLEEELRKKIEKEVSRVIQYTQKLNSDIIGFGEIYRANVGTTKVNEEKWNELYPTMKVNVKVDMEILRNGVFD